MNKSPTGMLYKKMGYYYARIYYYVDGKRKSKDKATGIAVDHSSERKAKKQEREANRILNDFLNAFIVPGTLNVVSKKDQLLTDTAKDWLEHVSKSKAPGTQSSYAYNVRDIVLYFGTYLPVQTAELTSKQVEAYLDWERKRRQPNYTGEHKVRPQYADGSGIENSVKHRYATLRAILNYAKREGIVNRNVASQYDCFINVPKPQCHEFPVLSEKEANDLVKALASEEIWFRVAVLLGLMLGLRRSEVIGLRFADIDYESNILTVSRTATQQTIDHKNTVIIKPFTKNRKPKVTKLKSSLGYVIRVLEEHHRQNRIAFGSDYDMRWDGYLIRYSDGKLVSPNVLTQHFKLFIQKHDFKAIRFHDLRHSCASILFANGVDLLTLQLIMGHAQLSTTMMYTHVIDDRMGTALSQMEDIVMPGALSEWEMLEGDRKNDRKL